MAVPSINPARLLADLHTLRQFGGQGNGVVRQAFSEADMASRRWLQARMAEAGLASKIDGVGNVIGYARKPGRALLMGSHTDTQPEGGWLDGAYGVIAALEVARALDECPETRHLALDIASWADEEHTYHGFLGSQGFLGQLEPSILSTATRNDGHPLSKALADAGLNGQPDHYDPARYIGYLEAHIEQGPRLELAGKQVGIVTGIVGCRTLDITFHGEANHAGSTPMDRRRDAGKALFRFAHQMDTVLATMAAEFTVWTVGRVQFYPGSASVIPGKAFMRLQYRDTCRDLLGSMETAVRDLATQMAPELGVTVSVERQPETEPVLMNEAMQEALAHAAEQQLGQRWMKLPSAALHDANMFGQVMPSAMLFVPSIGGISHNFAEDTQPEDLVAGCQVLATAAARIIASGQ